MKKVFVFTGLLLFIQLEIFPQIPNGSWRDHLAYHRANGLAITPKKVYCTFEKSGILAYNKETGEIEKISRIQGLKDINPTAIKYAEDPEILIIGYNSGNIDLITHDGIYNMSDIIRKSMVGSKSINSIECFNNLAYLACDFGIVILDLEQKEIKDTYMFNPNGGPVQVNDLTIFHDTIFAATDIGLYNASLNSVNLLDYSYWHLCEDVPEANVTFKFVEKIEDNLFAVYKSTVSGKDEIILKTNDIWSKWTILNDTAIYGIEEYNGLLNISGISRSIIIDNRLNVIQDFELFYGNHLLTDESGKVFYSSKNQGFGYFENNEQKYISVNSPRFNTTGKVFAREDQVWVGSGGPFRPYTEGGGYNFKNENWKSLNNGWNEGMDSVGNFYKFAFHPSNPNRVFVSAYMYGLYEIEDLKVVQHFKWYESELFQSTVEKNVGVRIIGLDFDSKGKLWTVFNQTNQPIYSFDPENNTWKNHVFSSNIFKSSTSYADLIVTQNNQIWVLSRNDGIVVLKEALDGGFYEKSFPVKNMEGQDLSYAYCLSEDNDGNIWVGTNRGPIIYNTSDEIFSDPDVRGYQVRISRNDGTGLADFLLDYEIINDIAVDGGNRKWIATESSGVFLISEDGKKTVHHFTKENQPLFSNNIIGIDIQEKTGEVFISTNLGLLSFMGSATDGNTDFENVYVYPNPVRPGYEGEITITGLVANAYVKITDVSGNLVNETKSLGGQAVWDGKDFNGKKVSTGIYLVFLSNEDGSKTYVTKLLFIH